MSRKIVGITVGTPLSPRSIKDKINPVISVNGVEADENGNVEVNGDFTEADKAEIVEEVKQIVDDYLEENPPVPQITINGKGPDENGNFVVQTQPGSGTVDGNNVVEF